MLTTKYALHYAYKCILPCKINRYGSGHWLRVHNLWSFIATFYESNRLIRDSHNRFIYRLHGHHRETKCTRPMYETKLFRFKVVIALSFVLFWNSLLRNFWWDDKHPNQDPRKLKEYQRPASKSIKSSRLSRKQSWAKVVRTFYQHNAFEINSNKSLLNFVESISAYLKARFWQIWTIESDSAVFVLVKERREGIQIDKITVTLSRWLNHHLNLVFIRVDS